MTLDSALDDAMGLQARKQDTHRPAIDRARSRGLGPDRPMPFIAAIRAGDLAVDHSYQRELDAARVRQMVETWDPTMLGVLDVSDRGEVTTPRYWIVNGQHRHATAVRADPRGNDVPLVCNVHRGLTVEEEAALFHELDATTRRLTSWDRWHARRRAGDPVVADIERIVAARGMRVSPGRLDGYIGAAGALEHLHSIGGPQLVAATLDALTASYSDSYAAYQAPIVSGVGLLLHYYPDIDPDRLDTALTKSTPNQLRAQAVAYRELAPGALYRLVAQVLVNRMNAGRGPRLPDIRDQVPATARVRSPRGDDA
jgi:hypothetical protein